MRRALHLTWVVAFLALPAAAQDFRETEANDPQTCRALWKDVGLPRYAREGDRDTIPVCHQRYILSHNNDNKTPDWVFEQLSPDQITGTNTRPKPEPFGPESNVPSDKAASLADCKGSHLDRGHQAPSEDFKKRLEWMKESFFLSNMVPQQGVGFNQHIWKNLEELTRGVVRRRGTMYVMTGPVNRDENGKVPTITKDFNKCGNEIRLKSIDNRKEICAAKNKDSSAKCDAGVTVPVGMFKIFYDPRGQRVNAYLLPNINHTEAGEAPSPADYLKKFRVTVHAVERVTGLEFFRDLPKRTRDILLLQCGQTMFGATDGDGDI
jgi:DNA/RNA endonuclease G (NUC1)